ncbi:MAG TPA: YchF/TatD family DNA exonuclease [Ignavibacteriaceae bacterium]|jgi:TatD DNase family protein|nr:MAG: putative deoxyribonuclease YcfH [Ignavibacteria bacterium ADurb.Bin266]OQY73740.1 MAG: radical SAM protein [Ignavibacteriales bacterium UTCHB2]HQF43677.1 YchF/TatD family DNA exonuclease [Ignavibacteriaceae bacterium]HQI40956.1 YchF/TatD family DNA exonuclease [Ignavibacteriaceae bacterium]HQJ45601.1 YchF/TatD family DNA exonuclease [Ignavibacteriaceae bacterium]
MFVDTHAHLFFENFKDDIDEVINRSAQNGVDYIIVPATDIKTAKEAIALSEKYEQIYATVGVHPHDTKDWNDSLIKEIEELTMHPKVVGIGEIGLDYYYDFSPKEQQIKAFKAQLDLSLKLELPVVIHNRDSDEDMMKIIQDYCGTGLKAQFHCFNASLDDAIEFMRMNHFISFTGNITYKKSDSLREILKSVNLNHLLLETDSPFMTPVPFRGKRNEPANVKYVAQQVADVHKLSIEDVGRITSLNTFRFFGIGSPPKTSFTYKIHNSLYINITNRCNADCTFCRRKEDPFLEGYNLGMKKSQEPPAETYIKEIGDPKKYDEIVFCGYGEPTIRWDVVKKIAAYVKSNGGKTRLNTNGHGNVINKKDITPEMKGLIDTISISLNSYDSKQYAELMQVSEDHFTEMKNFARSAKKYVNKVVMSIVSLDEVEVEKSRKVVEDEIGVEFRVREYF